LNELFNGAPMIRDNKLGSQELYMNNSRQKCKLLFYTLSRGSS